MKWIEDYQLFLFDFDGLLVNTEELHYRAYQRMLQQRGYHLSWSFRRYCLAAHHGATQLRRELYAEFPELHQREPEWEVLYSEKKEQFCQLVSEKAVELIPGVEAMLRCLGNTGVERCVVTNSPQDVVDMIREQLPLLATIPHWITRYDYTHPKPHPECYETAIDKFAKADDRIIGFEDTVRGLRALQATRALPVLICHPEVDWLEDVKEEGVSHYKSFLDIPDEGPYPLG